MLSGDHKTCSKSKVLSTLTQIYFISSDQINVFATKGKIKKLTKLLRGTRALAKDIIWDYLVINT